VSDRDVGRGYRIVIHGAEDGGRLDLLREDKIVASRKLGRIARGSRLPVLFERVDETLTAVVGETAVSFLDLIPIEGDDADGAYLVFLPGEVAISDVTIDRRRGGLFVTALAAADVHRQDGRYRRAIREYEKFLRDHPKRPETRDARYRIALCQEQLGEDEIALAAFLAIVRDYRDEPRYVLAATFRAWSCALRLGRYDDAEIYLEAIRRESSLDSLLSSVPQETLTTLTRDYHLRAMRVADADPRRALRLYETCSELAGRLGMRADLAQVTYGAGDMLIALDDIDGALERYTRVASDLTGDAHLRHIATLKSAEAWRLKDRFDRARAAYQLVVESADNSEDISQWARLWLGDLFIEMGEPTQANECWRQSFESESLPGRLMNHLLRSTQPIPPENGGWYANDVAWFAARQAFAQHRDRDYADALAAMAVAGPAHDWPTGLARHALTSLPGDDDVERGARPAPQREPPAVLRSPVR
nr:tetratricopeptide repeat protein [Planctomycetota bacterium]